MATASPILALQDKDHPLPKRILVIGGGVSGLITLRNLVLHGTFDEVELVERRNSIGGVWYLEDEEASPKWQSPAYPDLIGNVLPEFLSFSSHPPFPDPPTAPNQPFPSLKETYDYLESFARTFSADGHIHCNTEVLKVEERPDRRWDVVLRGESERQEVWDAIVVCTGWHSMPYWPPTDGLSTLRNKRLAMHAKDWVGVDFHGLRGKKALVLGNAASANDIAAQLADEAALPGFVYRSIRRLAFPGFPSLPDEKIQDVKPVRKYSVADNGKVIAELTDGTTIDIDMVISGTGYRANPDFIYVRSTAKSSSSASPHNLMTEPPPTPYRIPSLYEHILYAPNPSLAFIGCIMSFTPFTIADLSSAWLALAWSNHLSYPSTLEERLQWETERLETTQSIKEQFSKDGEATNYISYNVLGFGEQAYAERLKKEILEAGEKGKAVGATLPVWSDEKTKERERMYDIKLHALKWEKGKKNY